MTDEKPPPIHVAMSRVLAALPAIGPYVVSDGDCIVWTLVLKGKRWTTPEVSNA